MPKKAKLSIIIGAVFLAVFLFFGCNKKNEEVQNQSGFSETEMQNKIDEQKAQIDKQQAKLEELQAVKDAQTTTETAKEEATPATRSVADEVYCQTNASNNTAEKYKKLKEYYDADEIRGDCIDKNSNDCDKAVSRAKKNWEEYKVKYETYHSRCD